MLLKYLAKNLINKLFDNDGKSKKNRLKKKKHKNSMIMLFGSTRYYLSILFGQWVLFAWNDRDYRQIEYEKFYKNEKTAKKYADKLKEKYDAIQIEKVYSKRKIVVGYLITAKGKKVEDKDVQLSDNIIFINKYIKTAKQ